MPCTERRATSRHSLRSSGADQLLVHGAGDVGEQTFPGHDAMVAHALREPGRLWRECSLVSSPSLDLPQCSSILTGREPLPTGFLMRLAPRKKGDDVPPGSTIAHGLDL